VKIGLFPVPHITIYTFWAANPVDDSKVEEHYFLTKRGAAKFMRKYSKDLSKEGYLCGFGGEPLWLW